MPYSMIKVWLLKKIGNHFMVQNYFCQQYILAKYSTIMYFKELHGNIIYYINIE